MVRNLRGNVGDTGGLEGEKMYNNTSSVLTHVILRNIKK